MSEKDGFGELVWRFCMWRFGADARIGNEKLKGHGRGWDGSFREMGNDDRKILSSVHC